MKTKEMYMYTELMGFGMSTAAFCLSNFFREPLWSVVCLVVLCVALVFHFSYEFSKKTGLAFYFICMFTFSIGGAILPILNGDKNWMSNLTDREYIVACNCMFLSCIFILLGSIFCEKYIFVFRRVEKYGNRGKQSVGRLSDDHFNIARVQRLAFGVFIITTAIVLIGEMDKLQFIRTNSYLASYTEYSTSSIVARAKIINLTSWFIGLAARPDKKRVLIYSLLGILNPILILAGGSRTAFASFILFVVFYLYNYSGIKFKEVHSSKKRSLYIFLAAVLCLIIVIPFLYTYGYARDGRTDYNQNDSIFQNIIQFFSSQGNSYTLIGYAERYKDQLPGICYSFGEIIDKILGNTYAYGTVDGALKTNRFGAIMTYILYQWNYLNLGTGVGSSYIAELYYDFNYMGIILGNFFIGGLLQKLVNWKRNSVIKQSIFFVLFYHMLAMPRTSLMEPFVQLFSLSSIVTFLFIFGASYKKKKLITNDFYLRKNANTY